MKVIIIKNDKFETIGFEVQCSDKTLFQWGVSPINTFNFQKEVIANDWIKEIFQLIELKATINQQEDFASNFFKIATRQNLLKKDQGVNFKEFDEELKRNKEKMDKIIKNIN